MQSKYQYLATKYVVINCCRVYGTKLPFNKVKLNNIQLIIITFRNTLKIINL